MRVQLYLVSPGPFNLGSEVLHSLVQASVAAQLGLHRRQIGAPLGFIDAKLVLLHPGQEVFDIANGHVIHLRPHLHGLLGDLRHWGPHYVRHGGRHGGLQAKVVIGAQVHQALMEAVNPAEMRNSTLYCCFFFCIQICVFQQFCNNAILIAPTCGTSAQPEGGAHP